MGVLDTQQRYQMPPPEIVELVDAPLTPAIILDPSRVWMAMMFREKLPSIADVSKPELRLAGLRIDPVTNGPSRQQFFTRLCFKSVMGENQRPVTGLPNGAKIGRIQWAPDGKRVAFTLTDSSGIRLWVAELETGVACSLGEVRLNGTLGTPFVWMSDSRTLVCLAVPEDRGLPPAVTAFQGPVVRESRARPAPSRTYQDLLTNSADEKLFEYYTTSQVVNVTLKGEIRPVGAKGIVGRVKPSPGKGYLLVEKIHRPFSFLVPLFRFPLRVEVWNGEGQVIRELADLVLAEEVPLGFDAVREGPRSFQWRADVPSTLFWVDAQDGGDPQAKVGIRDKLYLLQEPFEGNPSALMSLSMRFSGLAWGGRELALITEQWWKTRRMRTWWIAPDGGETSPRLLFDRSSEDRYSDPGTPLMHRNSDGFLILWTADRGQTIFLSGDGASEEGDRPFLDGFNLTTRVSERIFWSEPPYYERPHQFVDIDGPLVLTGREAVDEPTNYFIRDMENRKIQKLTEFPHPMPRLMDVKKELLCYFRKDGVKLTGTLYLPPGYTSEDGPLPLLMWAYPREFKSVDAAGQVMDSPYRFLRASPQSPLFLLTQGYAILDGPTMPIVGEGEQEANDSYVEQLVASAEAAVEVVVNRGIADRCRIAMGGHSYGGFMTANLLSHTDLFRAGIARSGAYNRTLTPFGFQAEERTLWEAPEVYFSMSAFMHADKIDVPLLLVHGEADNNPGTFPIQSERFYNALKGHGATVRLVMLPHESHSYCARESLMHLFWEMTRWLDKYLKNFQTEKKSQI